MSQRDYQAEPLTDNTETNIFPMESLSLDWGEFGRHKFLVIVDRATTYMWASIFDSLSSDNTIKFLKSILQHLVVLLNYILILGQHSDRTMRLS